MGLKIILTGATGFVGEGVLFACLEDPKVEEVLMLNRKHYDLKHPKLKECLVNDFMNLESVKEELKGYDVCFYCAGISSVGLDEKTYTHITYDLTMNLARLLSELNPAMVFNFISGASTDGSEQSKVMWARVKGKTENALMKLNFKNVYNFRPGLMKPSPGQKNVKLLIKVLYPVFKVLLPSKTITLKEVGQAMINVVQTGSANHVLEVKDIKILAHS